MQARNSIISAIGALAFATMISSATAAPVSDHENGSETRNHHSSVSHHSSAGPDWHPIDSNNLPFGSKRWWQQHPSGEGR
jgi:hypothetical protein